MLTRLPAWFKIQIQPREKSMNNLQKLRNQLAEHGYECTIEETKGLFKIAKRLKSMARMPNEELAIILDLENPQQRHIFNTIQTMRR